MKDYTVLSPFKNGDGTHIPGDIVSLSDADAAELIAVGAVGANLVTTSQLDTPTDPALRIEAIVSAIGKLDAANSDLWLRDGKPSIEAIVAILGWQIAAAERNGAWESMQASQTPASA